MDIFSLLVVEAQRPLLQCERDLTAREYKRKVIILKADIKSLQNRFYEFMSIFFFKNQLISLNVKNFY